MAQCAAVLWFRLAGVFPHRPASAAGVGCLSGASSPRRIACVPELPESSVGRACAQSIVLHGVRGPREACPLRATGQESASRYVAVVVRHLLWLHGSLLDRELDTETGDRGGAQSSGRHLCRRCLQSRRFRRHGRAGAPVRLRSIESADFFFSVDGCRAADCLRWSGDAGRTGAADCLRHRRDAAGRVQRHLPSRDLCLSGQGAQFGPWMGDGPGPLRRRVGTHAGGHHAITAHTADNSLPHAWQSRWSSQLCLQLPSGKSLISAECHCNAPLPHLFVRQVPLLSDYQRFL